MVIVMGEGMASVVPDTALLQNWVPRCGAPPRGGSGGLQSRAGGGHRRAARGRVESPRLATGELSLHPNGEVGAQGEQRPVGYRAAAGLTARLDVPAPAGQVATATVTAGGEAARVDGLALVVGDQAGVLAGAREAAWRDARARAEQYAVLAGVALSPVLRIEAVGGAHHVPLRDALGRGGRAGRPC